MSSIDPDAKPPRHPSYPPMTEELRRRSPDAWGDDHPPHTLYRLPFRNPNGSQAKGFYWAFNTVDGRCVTSYEDYGRALVHLNGAVDKWGWRDKVTAIRQENEKAFEYCPYSDPYFEGQLMVEWYGERNPKPQKHDCEDLL